MGTITLFIHIIYMKLSTFQFGEWSTRVAYKVVSTKIEIKYYSSEKKAERKIRLEVE